MQTTQCDECGGPIDLNDASQPPSYVIVTQSRAGDLEPREPRHFDKTSCLTKGAAKLKKDDDGRLAAAQKATAKRDAAEKAAADADAAAAE